MDQHFNVRQIDRQLQKHRESNAHRNKVANGTQG